MNEATDDNNSAPPRIISFHIPLEHKGYIQIKTVLPMKQQEWECIRDILDIIKPKEQPK